MPQSLVVADLDYRSRAFKLVGRKRGRNAGQSMVALHFFFASMQGEQRSVMFAISVKWTKQHNSIIPVYSVEVVDFREASSAVDWMRAAADADSTPQRDTRPSEDVPKIARAIIAFNSAGAGALQGGNPANPTVELRTPLRQ